MSFTDFGTLAERKQHTLSITHIATSTNVKFPAFITQFSDQYSVSWGNEQIYGRNDPIKPYAATTRGIQVGFEILAPTAEKARDNMVKLSKLAQMMYPVYSAPLNGQGANFGRTIKAPPLMRIKFANLIQSTLGGGLLGCIEGFSFAPNKEAGFFTPGNEIHPKVVAIDFRFTPQHENTLGWDENGQFLASSFPYSQRSFGPAQGEMSQSSLNNSQAAATLDPTRQ